MSEIAGPLPRRKTVAVKVGDVTVGGGAPIVVQSMTNTDTADVEATDRAGRGAGARRLRNRAHHRRPRRGGGRRAAHPRAAAQARHQRAARSATSITSATSCSPIIRPAPRRSTSTASIPAMSASRTRATRQFAAIIEIAIKHDKPVRIGANWGSLDQELLTQLMDENARSPNPRDARAVTREAMVQSALLSAARAEEIGLPREPHHPVGEGVRRAGPDRGLSGPRRALATTRSISASPKPAWARRASSPRRPRSASCCSRASATPSASR